VCLLKKRLPGFGLAVAQLHAAVEAAVAAPVAAVPQ